MPRLSPAQASAVRYLLGLPALAPARSTIAAMTTAGLIVGAVDRRRVHPDHRAALCDTAGMTDAEVATVMAALERWRRWDIEHAAADQEASQCRHLIGGLPGHLGHYVVAGERTLERLATVATNAADSLARSAADCRAEAARLLQRAEHYEADAATLRDLAAAALATPRPSIGV